jgi:Leucine-rich repeat (LRR) protein
MQLRRIKEAKKEQNKELRLDSCELAEIPLEVFEMKWLEKLDLSNNRLVTLYKAIENLQNLTMLDLRCTSFALSQQIA